MERVWAIMWRSEYTTLNIHIWSCCWGESAWRSTAESGRVSSEWTQPLWSWENDTVYTDPSIQQPHLNSSYLPSKCKFTPKVVTVQLCNWKFEPTPRPHPQYSDPIINTHKTINYICMNLSWDHFNSKLHAKTHGHARNKDLAILTFQKHFHTHPH